MTAVVVALTAVVGLLAILVVGLLRSHAEILRRLHALDGGAEGGAPAAAADALAPFAVHPAVPGPRPADGDFPPAVDIVGAGLRDDIVSVNVVASRHPVLLAFLSSSCMTCRPFWDAFADPTRLGLPGRTRPVVVTHDATEESPTRLADLARGVETVVLSSEAWRDYAVPGSPYVVWVVDGQVRGEGTGISWDQVRTLLLDAAGPPDDGGRRAAPMNERIDAELEAAGIRPGDPSLAPSPPEGQPT